MKFFCLTVAIISFIIFWLYFRANLINRSLNKKKRKMFGKTGDIKYSIPTTITFLICSLSVLLFVVLEAEDKNAPIQSIHNLNDYQKLYNSGNVESNLSVYNNITSLKSIDVEVEDESYVYGVTSNKLYKVNYTTGECEYIVHNINAETKTIFMIDKYIVVSYAKESCSKLVIYNKSDLLVYQIFYIDGSIIKSEALDNNISIVMVNEATEDVSSIGVQRLNAKKVYLNEMNYLKDTNFSKIVSHILINFDNFDISIKSFCCGDYFITYEDYYYFSCNMYMNSTRENKSMIFKYDPNTMKICKYAFLVGNVYMLPFVDEETLYINSWQDDDNDFYGYQLDLNLNIRYREKVSTEENRVLDYLLTSARIYNLDNKLYIDNAVFEADIRPFRDDDNLLIFKKSGDKLYIMRYLYETNKFESYNTTFTEDLNECKILSYVKSEEKIKILFRTNDKVGCLIINRQTGQTYLKFCEENSRIFLTTNNIVIIDGSEVEIIN